MGFYENMAKTASNLLTKYGFKVTFTRRSGGTYTPSTMGKTGVTTTTFSGYGATFDYESNQFDGSNILQGDTRLVVEKTSTVPMIDDTVDVAGRSYLVINVNQLSPAGIPVVYECQLRTGDRGSVR